ncbi:odorant receptor 23a-like [Drosophila takahashii]|uniref:odorant receptor 23a-like n=1 Tax=Drosophila takahashii TaxID=29030 RepID=UPI001CF7FBF5|nr:odorant receptor 23a-like [Drosophila takahashii]
MKLSKNFKIDYFRDQLLAWRIGGVIKLSEGNYWSWAMALNIFAFLQTPLYMKAMFTFENPIDNNYNLFLTITWLSTLSMFMMYVSKVNKMVDIHWLISKLDARVSGDDQILQRRKMTKHLQIMSKVFLVSYGIVFINASMAFFLRSERSLPLPMWIPFDWKNSMVAYIGALVYQITGLFVNILHNYSGDSFAPMALLLISEQCQILALRISSLGYRTKNWKKNERDLVDCIKDQNTLYRLLDVVHSMISYPILIQFVVIGISIAVTLFGLIFYIQTLLERIFYGSILVGLTLQIFPICYYGTKVEESFANLHYAVFCSNWVGQSPKYRGYMLILQERTKRQQILLAGDVVPIHLSTFVACWNGAYSFFTLMTHRSGLGS